MIRKMTAEEMDRTLRRSVMEQFLWGEVHTIDGEIVICIRGKETTISANDACRLAKVASGELRCCSANQLECGWNTNTWCEPPYAGFWILDGLHSVSIEVRECEASQFVAALRAAVSSLQSQSSAKNRTDDNLRSVFG